MVTDEEWKKLRDIKRKKRYEKKKINGRFSDMKEAFLKTSKQRKHMKKTTKHEKKILDKQTKLINSLERKK